MERIASFAGMYSLLAFLTKVNPLIFILRKAKSISVTLSY